MQKKKEDMEEIYVILQDKNFKYHQNLRKIVKYNELKEFLTKRDIEEYWNTEGFLEIENTYQISQILQRHFSKNIPISFIRKIIFHEKDDYDAHKIALRKRQWLSWVF